MFANIAEKTDWDLTGEMLLGLLLQKLHRSPLTPVAETLEKHGYILVGIREANGEGISH